MKGAFGKLASATSQGFPPSLPAAGWLLNTSIEVGKAHVSSNNEMDKTKEKNQRFRETYLCLSVWESYKCQSPYWTQISQTQSPVLITILCSIRLVTGILFTPSFCILVNCLAPHYCSLPNMPWLLNIFCPLQVTKLWLLNIEKQNKIYSGQVEVQKCLHVKDIKRWED